MTKEQEDLLRRSHSTKKKDSTTTIWIVSIILALIFVGLGAANWFDIINLGLPPEPQDRPMEDTTGDGIADSGDGNITSVDLIYRGNTDSDGDGIPDQGEHPINRAYHFMVLTLIVLVGPYGFYRVAQDAKIEKIEKKVPDFLRDVAEAGRFGMTLADSVIVASQGRYGALTPEIKKMAAQIEWGVPAADAFRLFSKRVDTPLVNRISLIVVKSSEAGGSVADVLSMVSIVAKDQQLADEERNISMGTYIAVIYISFYVFLATIMILNATFLPKMLEASQSIGAGEEESGEAASGPVSGETAMVIPVVQRVFIIAAIIHAVGDGILAGVLVTGQIYAGFKHSTIMLITGYGVLKIQEIMVTWSQLTS